MLINFLFYFVLFYYYYYFLAVLHDMWDLSFLTRDRTHAPAVEVWSPKLWAAREFPQ